MRLRFAAGIVAVGFVMSACSGVGEWGFGVSDDDSNEVAADGGATGQSTGTTAVGVATGDATSTTRATTSTSAPTDTTADDGDDGDDAATEDAAEETTTTTEPPPRLVPVVEGDSGDDVVVLQELLDELGFGPGPVDGSYGDRTVLSVERFQELVGLPPTGEANQATLDALDEYTYDGVMLHAGDEGREVTELQERLAAGPLDPGPADGHYGTKTVEAVWALEKLAEVPVDGDWGPLDELAWERLMDGKVGRPEESNEQRWVEIDLSQQLVKVYDPGETMPFLVSHASSGSGIPWSNENHSGNSITPLGDFSIYNRIPGWRESSLDIGRLYNPLYFNGGIALHGSLSVPLHPASHGCVRLPMHIAEYLPDELPDGTAVHVLA